MKNIFWLLLIMVVLRWDGFADAQQAKKLPQIGYLVSGSPSPSAPRIEALRQALRELGYVEGNNITIEYRYGEEKFDRLPALADELVRLSVDVIVTSGTPPPPCYPTSN